MEKYTAMPVEHAEIISEFIKPTIGLKLLPNRMDKLRIIYPEGNHGDGMSLNLCRRTRGIDDHDPERKDTQYGEADADNVNDNFNAVDVRFLYFISFSSLLLTLFCIPSPVCASAYSEALHPYPASGKTGRLKPRR